jgi:ABC-type multidrug transport system fused ATPase/permease subunit
MGGLKAPMNIAKIYVTGLLVDSVVDYYAHVSGFVFYGVTIPYPVLYLLLLTLMARSVKVFDGIYQIAHIRIRNNAIAEYRKLVAEKFHKLNAQEVDQESVKDKLIKIEMYWTGNSAALYGRIPAIIEYSFSVFLSFIALFTVSPAVAFLVMLVPVPEMISHYRHYRKHAHFVDDIAPVMLERNYYFQTLTDARTFPERKINGVFGSLIDRYNHVASIVSAGYKSVLVVAQQHSIIWSIIDHVFLVLLRIYIVIKDLIARVHVGKITATIGYIDSLYSNTFDLINNCIMMFDELTFVEYLYELLDVKGFADGSKRGKRLLKGGIPEIEFRNVTFRYPSSGKVILNQASFRIVSGAKVMILGKDGSGKSSLLSIMAGLYELKEGDILYSAISMRKLARNQVKAKMSVVPEDFARYYMTLKNNVVLGDTRKPFDEKLYKQALDISGLTSWLKESHIDDEKTVLGNYFDGSVSISSGHWQRIAIARAIYRNRDIFILDQPFTYIDRHSVEEIFPKLLKFIGKRTLIFISEDHRYAKDFDAIYELQDHKVVSIQA